MPYKPRKIKIISPSESAFRRLPMSVQQNYLMRARCMGVDYIDLYQKEQQQRLDNMFPAAVSSPQILDNCTENTRDMNLMPSSEGAEDMKKRQKLTINGQERWVQFSSTQELIDLVQAECAQASQITPTTVEKYMLDWFETYKRPQLDPNTAAGEISKIKKHILPVIGKKQLNNVCVSDIQSIVTPLKSASTAKQVKSIVNQCFDAAIADELYSHPNPAADKRIVMPTAVTKRNPLEKEDVAILMEALPKLKPELACLLTVLIMTGCRRSEALAICWEDIDWEKKRFIYNA